jgi:hypothetical protein
MIKELGGEEKKTPLHLLFSILSGLINLLLIFILFMPTEI